MMQAIRLVSTLALVLVLVALLVGCEDPPEGGGDGTGKPPSALLG